MAKIATQIKDLRKKIRIPWRIVYVDKEILANDFQPKTIYVHIWI